jgi:hypothetical protein
MNYHHHHGRGAVVHFSISLAAFTGATLIANTAAAGYLVNPGLDAIGPSGSPVTTSGGNSAASAALGWYQFTVVPTGSLTTTELPTTNPSGWGNMLKIVTNSGDYPPAEQGNGWGQAFLGGAKLEGVTVSFDIDVIHGQVTGGLTEDNGAGIGRFIGTTPTLGPTGGWIHVTDTLPAGQLADGVFFETLTLGQGVDWGATYYVDNIQLSYTPEPAAWGMMILGMAGIGGVLRRSNRSARV